MHKKATLRQKIKSQPEKWGTSWLNDEDDQHNATRILTIDARMRSPTATYQYKATTANGLNIAYLNTTALERLINGYNLNGDLTTASQNHIFPDKAHHYNGARHIQAVGGSRAKPHGFRRCDSRPQQLDA